MKKTAIFIMIFTIISKIMGFIREIALSFFYGTSNISDAFLISLTIPISIFSFIGAAITTGYIPIYSKIKSNTGEKIGNDFTNNLLNTIIIICVVSAIIIFILAPYVVKFFAVGFDDTTVFTSIQFTRITVFSIIFNGIIYVLNGYLQANGKFIFSTGIIIIFNLIAITGIIISSNTTIYMMPMGILIGILLQSVLIIIYSIRNGYKYKLFIDYSDIYLKDMFTLAMPIIVGASISQVNMLVDKTIASTIAVGGISALNYAHKLQSFIIGMFVTSISTVMYPKISFLVINKDISGLKKILNKLMGYISIILIPSMVGFMTLSDPIIKLLFGRGAFNSDAIFMTSKALFFYSIGLLGLGMYEILSRAFYAMLETRVPVIVASIGVLVNIILNIVFSKYMGISGLALATSIASLLTALLLYLCMWYKIGSIGTHEFIKSFIKMLVAAIIMGFSVVLINNTLNKFLYKNTFMLIINLGFSIFSGIMVYFFLLYVFRVKEVNFFMDIIKKIVAKFSIGR